MTKWCNICKMLNVARGDFADWLRNALAEPHDVAAHAELKKALRRTRLALALLAAATATARVLQKRAQRRDNVPRRETLNND